MTETNSCPIQNSDHIGVNYISNFKINRENLGQYFTPIEVSRYMASLLKIPNKSKIKILDPGAGSGVLIASAIKHLVENDKDRNKKEYRATLYEIDNDLIPSLTTSMNFLKKWCDDKSVDFKFKIENKDYILENATSLDDEPTLFTSELFDIVISNPPYFKVSKEDKRAIACSKLVYGQPNIYSLFMGVAASQLDIGGQFLFITPRSFSSGQYFKAFRKFFFEKICIKKIHVFDSRTDAFQRDAVLQENIITYGERVEKLKKHEIEILSSSGKSDINNCKSLKLSSSDILDEGNDFSLALPSSLEDASLLKKINSWTNSLEQMGLTISTGPVVPFRATEYLQVDEQKDSVPLLWIQHILPMRTKFPLEKFRKQAWIKSSAKTKKILTENQNMILMRRFSPKEDFRRLTVAPYLKNDLQYELIGLENHLNYIYSKNKTFLKEELYGLSAFLNSKLFDSFFRVTNGNTQVSATELRAASLPDRESIQQIGKTILKSKKMLHSDIDIIVNDVLGIGEA